MPHRIQRNTSFTAFHFASFELLRCIQFIMWLLRSFGCLFIHSFVESIVRTTVRSFMHAFIRMGFTISISIVNFFWFALFSSLFFLAKLFLKSPICERWNLHFLHKSNITNGNFRTNFCRSLFPSSSVCVYVCVCIFQDGHLCSDQRKCSCFIRKICAVRNGHKTHRDLPLHIF